MALDQEFKNNIRRAFYFPILFISILWLVKGWEYLSGMSFSAYGIFPLKKEGIPGIILAPFIHADFNHLFNNSFSLLILMTTICYFYKPIAFKIIILVWIITGLCVWIGGRKAYHIGASGLVYGFASFLFFSGVFRKNIKLLAISLLVIFLYGGLIWGIFPIIPEISWESHLFGGLTGLFLAFLYTDEGPQKEEKHWEDDTNEEEFPYWLEDENTSDDHQKK
jgi:membrane associated rhomboid family serine protease